MSKLPKPFYAWTTYAGHAGIDYPRATGTPIMADRPGRITFSGWYNNRSGYMKEIDHGGGVRQRYYHLVNLNGPKLGEWVPEYNHIGYVGNTGTMSTGPHLHHEVWINGSLKAPNLYWNYVDRFKVVTVPPPPPPPPAPTPKKEEIDMEPKLTIRTTGGTEASLIAPWIGLGLATGKSLPDPTGAPVTIWRGRMVSADPDVILAWQREYAEGSGTANSKVPREGYIEIQQNGERMSFEYERSEKLLRR